MNYIIENGMSVQATKISSIHPNHEMDLYVSIIHCFNNSRSHKCTLEMNLNSLNIFY